MKSHFIICYSLLLTMAVYAQQATEIDPKSLRTPRYTNLAAITTAIPTPQSGMMVYNLATQSNWTYNGTAWVNTVTPASGIQKLSYESILALPSPQNGDMVYDLTFRVLRVREDTEWRAISTVGGRDLYGAFSTSGLGPLSVAVDGSGNIYLTGDFSGTVAIAGQTITSAGSFDIFIAKYNTSGTLQWLRRGGGTGSDSGEGIAVDGSGNVYVIGNFQGTANFNTPSANGSNELVSAGDVDIFIAKYNTSGTLQWLRRGGSTQEDYGQDIAVDGSGNVYVTGGVIGTANFNTPSASGGNELFSAGGGDIFVIKYNTSGTLQWLRRGGGTSGDFGNGIAVDGSGNVYVTGKFIGTANFNTPSANGTNELVSAGSDDIFIAKYNTSGTLQWILRGGGASGDSGDAIAVDGSGNVYVTGIFQSTANFNTPSVNGSNELVSAGSFDIFIAKYNTSGTLQWLRRGGGTSGDFSNGIAVDGSGNVYVTGYFQVTANFNTPSASGGNELISAGNRDIFIAKYNTSGTLQWLRRGGGVSSESVSGIAVGGSERVIAVGANGAGADFGASILSAGGFVWVLGQ